ncbi:MAG: GNAT family N-acetyltransferase [Lachnospiraceae bacterium]|nr:GNAT family N-acetyltransferase [Lachnospiraceae bacterium]
MIRKAELKDIDGLNNLLYQVHRVHAEGRPDYFVLGQKKYTDEGLAQLIQEGLDGCESRKAAGYKETAENPIYVYVDENGMIAGHAFCMFEINEGNHSVYPRKNLYIDDICVDSDHRRQGIGEALYEYVLQVAKENECDSITLNVWELNPGAKAFYEKCGLKPLKTVMEQTLS